MKYLAILLAAGWLSAIVMSPASAAIVLYGAAMSGAQEAPPNSSPATGRVLVYHDTVLDTLRVVATFSGLTGNTTAAHIHGPITAPGGTAGVITAIPSFPGFPNGVTSGSMDQTFDLNLASTYRAGFISASGGLANARSIFLAGLAAGTTYFNIHTTAFPGGEIRGFLVVGVPEPSSIALLGGFAVVSGWRLARRKRSQAQV